MADFLMPALGADMETGKLVQWLVQPGSRVKAGDVVAVVETQKGAIDVEIFLDGVIEDLVPLGTQLPIGSVLARVRPLEPEQTRPAGTIAPPVPPEPTPAPLPTSAPAPGPVPVPTPAPAPPPVVKGATDGLGQARAKATPAARLRAQELGLDVREVKGSGPEGSVVLADVEHAAANMQSQTRTAAAAPPATRGFDPTQMRAAIAAAMGRSKREIPHYYLTQLVDFSTAERWLASYNADKPPAERLLAAALLLKATAHALAQVPQLNGFYENGAIRSATGIHIGWAISLRGGGLVAPAIHDADRKSLPELMMALRDLVQRARTGGLRSSELSDPTITVTSLGERGADSVVGVIYPPQLALIGFGRVAPRPWVEKDLVVARSTVHLSLAADHRASDGHLGGQLLAAIDEALQHPDAL